MAEVEYMHICDYAFQAMGGKACIIGIFDRIHTASLPTRHPYMSVAIQLHGHQGEVCELQVELLKPDGDNLATANARVPLSSEGRAFVHLAMVGVKFPVAGNYTFRITAGDRVLTTQTLRLIHRSDPQQPRTVH